MSDNWEALLAAHLRFEHGVSYKNIAKRLKRPEAVIKGWIAYYEEDKETIGE